MVQEPFHLPSLSSNTSFNSSTTCINSPPNARSAATCPPRWKNAPLVKSSVVISRLIPMCAAIWSSHQRCSGVNALPSGLLRLQPLPVALLHQRRVGLDVLIQRHMSHQRDQVRQHARPAAPHPSALQLAVGIPQPLGHIQRVALVQVQPQVLRQFPQFIERQRRGALPGRPFGRSGSRLRPAGSNK